MAHSGANWIASSFKVKLSPLGAAVADLLGEVFLGIYHLETSRLGRVNWQDEYCIVYNHARSMSTIDSDELFRLVLRAHDRMIRVELRAVAPRCLEIMFHQRHTRIGFIAEKCPTMEDHIIALRRHYTETGASI